MSYRHTHYYSHKKGILDLLKCESTRASIQEALLQWNSQDFEDQVAANNLCATKSRTFDEWDKHPQALALDGKKLVEIIKVGEAPKRGRISPFDPDSPLDGIRVLDLTRILAGPVAGRTIAGVYICFICSGNRD